MRSAALLVVLLVACKSSDPAPVSASGSGSDQRHDRHQPVIADAPPLEVGVRTKGVASKWDKAAFDSVPRYTKGSDGENRDVWSLRELAHVLVGPTARVVSVTGEGGDKPFDRAGWDDPTRTPILHTTRRGTLKLAWADADGKWGDTLVKDVTQLVIEP